MPILPFVHPWIAASAVVLAAVPIIIHILNRRRFRRVVWAAMGFLSAAQRRSARRVRFEQLILLAVRTLVMILIALAIARPLLDPSRSAGLGQATMHRLIVLDDSYSMGMARPGGQRAFDRGVSAALKLLGSFGRGDGVSVILAGQPARALIPRPSYDRQAVAKSLEQCELSDAATDMAGALGLAAELLSESDMPSANRTVYVITDGTAAAWSGAGGDPREAIRTAARRVADDARLFIIDIGPDERHNVAVSSLKLVAPAISAEWPATILAEVTNHGRQEAHDLRLQVLLGGQVVRTEPIQAIPPNETRPVQFRLQLPGPGSHQVQARVVGRRPDVLGLDDVRWMSIAVRKQVPVLLVDGRPAADRFAGQVGYLGTALAPKTAPGDPTLANPRIVMTGEITTEPLSDYAMIALCNVRQLGRRNWTRLGDYVRQGGGLVVYMGDQVSMEDYNRFGFDDGGGILPARIAGLAGSEDDRGTFVRVRAEPLLHPAVADFAGQPRSGLFLARFYRYARLRVPPELDGAAVILRYDNGDAAVAVRNVGRGRVVMVSFSANMDWTNLPAKGDYVSLTLGLLAWVVPDQAAGRNVVVGEPLSEALTGRAASLPLTIVGPDGLRRRAVPASQPSSGGVVARYERTDRAGGYKLMVGSRAIDFSVNVDPGEGDLRRITAQALHETLGCEFAYTHDVDQALAATAAARREISSLLLWAVMGLLAVEMLLAVWFGHHRG